MYADRCYFLIYTGFLEIQKYTPKGQATAATIFNNNNKFFSVTGKALLQSERLIFWGTRHQDYYYYFFKSFAYWH
jgi:hypothetical protein